MFRYSGFICLLVAFVLPTPADAQFGMPHGMNYTCKTKHKCRFKRRPFARSFAPPMVPHCPQMIPQPVMPAPVVCPQVQTTYRQEQFTTYQPVTRTHVRREAVQVNVPVTTHKQVTVDEGGYKMVWVPKLTTKTVAETTVQKQVQYRDVPYQVVENVPQVHTRIVPQQTVAYHPQSVAMAKPCCQSNAVSMMPTQMFTAVPAATVVQAPVASPAPVAKTAPQPGEWVKVPQKVAAPEQAEASSEIQLQNFERYAPVKSAEGMFSRPSSNSTALRTSRLF